MEIAFSMKFPLRGTIGVGEILFDLENKILLSKKFPELVKGESVQDWSGCFLYDYETEELVLKAIFGERWSNPGIKRSSLLISYNVPVKSKSDLFSTAKYCLNWVHLLGKNDFECGIDFLKGSKKDETLKFAKVVQSLTDDSSPLSKEHAPATVMKVMTSIAQMRTCFQDESGNPVDPGADVEITLQQPDDTNQYKMKISDISLGLKNLLLHSTYLPKNF
tara:strand:- start:881 stop:1540 length:660 start_codon:yes stop_codon:yes gene_type:complete